MMHLPPLCHYLLPSSGRGSLLNGIVPINVTLEKKVLNTLYEDGATEDPGWGCK